MAASPLRTKNLLKIGSVVFLQLHYGFTIEDNREADGKCQNEVCVKLALLSGPDPHRNLRQNFVHPTLITRVSMNAEDSGALLTVSALVCICPVRKCCVPTGTVDALLFARVAVATKEELMYVADIDYVSCQVSVIFVDEMFSCRRYWLNNMDNEQSPEIPINVRPVLNESH